MNRIVYAATGIVGLIGLASYALAEDPPGGQPAGQTVPNETAVPRDLASRIAAFHADEAKTGKHDFPAWNAYRKIVSDTQASRDLFADMLKAEPELLALIGGPRKRLADLLDVRVSQLATKEARIVAESGKSVRPKIGFGRIGAVVLAASRPEAVSAFPGDDAIFNLLTTADGLLWDYSKRADTSDGVPSSLDRKMRQWEQPDPVMKVLKTLIAHWAEKETKPEWIHLHLATARRFRIDDLVVPLSIRLLSNPKGNSKASWAVVEAIMTILELDKRNDRALLSPYLERRARLSDVGKFDLPPTDRRSSIQAQPELRDLALYALVTLSGKKPVEYGLERCVWWDSNNRQDVDICLFKTIEQRNRGFAKCIECYKELGLEKPPEFAPEKLPPFYYVRRMRESGVLAAARTSPDGKVSLQLRGDKARLIVISNGKPVGKDIEAGEAPNDTRKSYTFTCWSFSPDGKFVVTGSSYKSPSSYEDPRSTNDRSTNVGKIEVWDTSTGNRVDQYRFNTGSIQSVGFNDDNKTIFYWAEKFSIDKS